MKKILCILMSVVLSISFLTYTVGAEQIYSGDFLKEKYTVYDSSIANENIGGNVLISQDALQGKTEISCDFSISSDFVSGAINLVAKKLNKSDTDILVSFSFLKDDNSTFKLDCGNGFIVNSLDFDKIYSLVVQIDFNNRKYNVVLYENHDKNCLIIYKGGISLENKFVGYGLSDIGFTGDVKVSYLSAYRERTAVNTPVINIDDDNNIANVSAVLLENIEKGESYDIYVVFYKDDSRREIADVMKKTYKCFDNYAEASFDLNDSFKERNYSVSVFAFKSEDMTPIALVGKLSDDDTDGVEFNMECTQKTSWYTLNDTVTYTLTDNSKLNNVAEIRGTVYNSDGTIVDSVVSDLETVQSNGWNYTPIQSGYYKVIFYAVTESNRIVYEYRMYNTIYDKELDGVKMDKSGHNFYVTSFENKDWDDRNALYGMSIDRYDGEYDMDIAKQLGMSFIRLHAFSWKDIQPTQDGEFIWTKTNGATHFYEKIFNRIENGDKFDVIANILYTPLWASTNTDTTEASYDFPEYAKYAPSDNKYLTDFIDKLYEKYGKYISTWEIYNEPNVSGCSSFWHDTTENYVSMLGAAYNEIKKLSAEDSYKSEPDTVTMGGIGPSSRYLTFYKEFLAKGGGKYTDKIAMHGYDIDPWVYTEANGNKKVINTEAHMMLFSRSTDNFYYTEKQLALRTFKEYLKQIKYGVEKIAFFQPYENHVMGEDVMKFNDAYYNDGNQWAIVMAGLYRKKPSIEPRFVAGALNTLIAKSGTVTEYVDEYKTGNVNIVRLTADDKPLYILWGDDLAAQNNDAELNSIINNASITDWEGRAVLNEGFKVGADEVYFIEGLSDDAFSYLDSAKGAKLYLGDVLYSEYEKNARTSEGPLYIHSDVPLYESIIGSGNMDNVKWNKMYTYENTADLDGQLAIHTSKDGLECVMRVDNTDSNGNSVPTSKAEMLIGVDTTGNVVKGDTVQFTAKFTPEDSQGMRVYKSVLPYIGGDVVDNTGLNEPIQNAKINIYEAQDGHKYFYIFIPVVELYPFNYASNYKINVGVQFRGYQTFNGSVRKSTYCRMNEKENYNVNKPWQFASIQYADEQFPADADELTVNKVIYAEAGEYVSVAILKNNEVVYLNQYLTDSYGKCQVFAIISDKDEGTYTLRAYSRSKGYTIIKLN